MQSRVVMAVSLAVMVSTIISGCGSKKGVPEDKPSPYVAGNYPGNLKIGNPYDIDGRTYIPAYDPDYDETGVASWYGPGFHGRSTANGERFDQHALTAAHRTLPLPSVVRVTNTENGKIAVLTVNDRGPFKKDRIIDLSKASAEKLGVIASGTAPVRVEYLPVESRRMVIDLVRNNKLKASQDTLAMLGIDNLVQENAIDLVADVQPTAPRTAPSSGFGLVSSAAAATPAARRAAASSMASGSLQEAPEEMRLARLDNVAAMDASAPQYMLDETENVVAVAAPNNLQQLPDSQMQDTPLYKPLDAPEMPTPQAQQYDSVANTNAVTSRPNTSPSGIFIQAGSFSESRNANNLSQRIASIGQTSVKPVEISGRTWYRVRVGPLTNMNTAHSALRNLQNMGISDAHVVKD
ncbi:MAG: septal ring lytic transglycosylase RlpA family protein [Alphaproteobacteria bacterium]|nr:septal ring lytic transglycosylase RlpA family protein [Alphaproteobacteria bacterium]